MLQKIRLHGFEIGLDEESDPPPIVNGMRRGWYEGREVRTVAALLTSDDRVVELGAGLGVVTCQIASRVGSDRVLAFEPNPIVAARARDHLAWNGFSVPVTEKVLRPRPRVTPSATFSIAPVFWGSSLIARADAQTRIEVPVGCLEEVLFGFGATVLVMDIEGGEIEILEEADLGGLRALAFETHEAMVGRARTNAAIDAARQQGFLIDFTLSGDGVVVLRREN